jgi:hypothetical protein
MSSRQQRKFQFRLIVTVTAATLIGIAITAYHQTNYAIGVVQQGRERLLHRLPREKNEPVAITSIALKDKPISFDEKFVADDDWLRDIALSVGNRSSKLILLVSFRVQFPRPPGSSEPESVGNLYYGNPELFARPPAAHERKLGLAPGKSARVQLTENQFAGLQSMLKATGYPESIDTVNLKINKVIFDDDTMWQAGEILHRDKQNPNSWWVDSQKTGTFKRPSVRFRNVNSGHGQSITMRFANLIVPRRGKSLSRAFRELGTPPQNTCWKLTGTIHLSCDVPGWSCTYEKDVLNTDVLGNYYLGNGSILCSNASCGYHSSQFANQCSGGGGGGGCIDSADCECDCVCYEGMCSYATPILIDLSGNGFALTDENAGVNFDLNGDGVAMRVAWTTPNSDDAWLVLDRNGNGTIDSGTELFGDVTAQPPSDEPNGFLALAEFDKEENGGNEDSVVDSEDAVFGSLRLWQDKNHNGFSEASELRTLSSCSVSAIDLDYRESRKRDRHGNQFRYRAKVYDTHKTKVGRWAWDVALVSSP